MKSFGDGSGYLSLTRTPGQIVPKPDAAYRHGGMQVAPLPE